MPARPMSAAPRRSEARESGLNVAKDVVQPPSSSGSHLGARGVQRRRPSSAMARASCKEENTEVSWDDVHSVSTTRPVSAQSRASNVLPGPSSSRPSSAGPRANYSRPSSAMSRMSSSGAPTQGTAEPYTERR